MAKAIPNSIKRKNKCVSCVYLCQDEPDTFNGVRELNESQRARIRSSTLNSNNESIYKVNLRCRKGLITPDQMNDSAKDATCPSRGWRLHTDGKTPQMSLEQERQEESYKWSKLAFWGVVATLLISIATLVVTCIDA